MQTTPPPALRVAATITDTAAPDSGAPDDVPRARPRGTDLRSPYSGGLTYAPGLDGLRALAVAGVLLYHAEVGWLPGGFLGVDVFFVLSGYLITSLLLAEYRGTGRIALARFWAARGRRVLPAALLVIAVCLVIGAVFLRGDLQRLRSDALASVLNVNNWHQVLAERSYFSHFGRPSLLQHFWSLSLEEQFYLVWPLFLLGGLTWLGRRRIAAAAAVAATASLVLMALVYHAGSDPSRAYYGTDTRAGPLMIGAVLAFAWPLGRMTAQPGRGAGPLLDAIGFAGLAGLILAMHGWHDFDPFLYRGGFLLTALAAGAVIVAAVHPVTRLGATLARPALRWIGQRSYGIYLWHWPIMAVSRPGVDIAVSKWILVPAQIALTVTLAAVSYRYVEMPVRRRRPAPKLAEWFRAHPPRERLGLALAATVLMSAVVISATIVPVARSRSILTPLASHAAMVSPVLGAPRQRPHGSAPPSPVSPVLTSPRPYGPAAPPPSGRPSGQSRVPVGAQRGPVLAVGASVMLAAEPALEHQLGAKVDAAVGRQPTTIIDRLAAYRAADALPAEVVVQIGDNGPVWSSDLTRLRQVLRGVRRVVLVNTRESTSWEGEVNNALVGAVRTWPQATVADWHSASSDPSLLYDGAHPDPAGQAVYARILAAALRLRTTRSVAGTAARTTLGTAPRPTAPSRPASS